MDSPLRLARIAGLLYLIVAVFGGFAFAYVLARVYTPGDASVTAANVLANSGLVRIGIVADLIQATVFAFLGMTFYQLLKPVNKNAARSMMILVAIATTIMCLNLVFEFAAMFVATNPSYATAFGAAGSNALVLLLLDMHHYGFLIAQVFFGLWLIPLGYLAYKSAMFPRALGVVLIAGGTCYLIDLLVKFLLPDLAATTSGFLVITPTIAELWMVGYLLIKGVKLPAQSTSTQRAAKTSPVMDSILQ
ncbi:MAG: DUF4386 domain-containing protein [Chloroflexia bacterium]